MTLIQLPLKTVSEQIIAPSPPQVVPQPAAEYTLVVPVSGETVNVGSNRAGIIINPVSTIATLTIVLPENPTDRQVCTIAGGSCSVILVTLVSSASIASEINSLASGASVHYYYHSAQNTWYRVG